MGEWRFEGVGVGVGERGWWRSRRLRVVGEAASGLRLGLGNAGAGEFGGAEEEGWEHEGEGVVGEEFRSEGGKRGGVLVELGWVEGESAGDWEGVLTRGMAGGHQTDLERGSEMEEAGCVGSRAGDGRRELGTA